MIEMKLDYADWICNIPYSFQRASHVDKRKLLGTWSGNRIKVQAKQRSWAEKVSKLKIQTEHASVTIETCQDNHVSSVKYISETQPLATRKFIWLDNYGW
jgi:hypothetical protein